MCKLKGMSFDLSVFIVMVESLMEHTHYWLGFNMVPGIGSAKLSALVRRFGDVETAWYADVADYEQMGLDKRAIRNLTVARQSIDLAAQWKRVQQANIDLLHWDSDKYPAALKAIPVSPPTLFKQGEFTAADQQAIAIVGTRRVSNYGRQMTQDIAAALVQNGVTIVSGLARGVDSIAHQTAVECGGRTIAVLGSGLDCIYPPENRQLAAQIINGSGVLLSEYMLGVQPEAKNFPPRNRIISGLSLGVIVIEAGKKSGALITARFADDQHKPIYALPGNVTNVVSAGPNKLIQQGAKLITSAADVLDNLNLERVTQQKAVQMALPDSAEEAALIAQLSHEPLHLDELIRQVNFPAALVSSTLTMLELKGTVQQVGGMHYVLRR